ncbi:hypothetical protein ZWY2020_014749 [Hordeum vulgare]|nr:hypothetical protein ZWY2020_014749 [Hordeum vulgare]
MPCTTLFVSGVALAVVAAVNVHCLGTHLAGVDCRVGLARFDPQLGLVELLAAALDAACSVVAVVGLTLQLFSQVRECRSSANARVHGPSIAAACSSSSLLPPCQARARDGLACAFNVRKVFVMHHSDTPRLEKLPGGAQEQLAHDREGRVPVVCRSTAPLTELHLR